MKTFCTLLFCLGAAWGQLPPPKDLPAPNSYKNGQPAMNEVYRDESHCLTEADVRSDRDSQITCQCRDAIMDARYIYFTYLLPARDGNLTGPILALQQHAAETCGQDSRAAHEATQTREWTWGGPEVVRTYPSDDVIQRIRPKVKDGKPFGRWVPFTIQLVYHDAQGRVTRTENYPSKELFFIQPK